MFFLQVLISFVVVVTVLLLALMVHWAVNKRRILANLRAVAPGLAGHVSAEGLFEYPRLTGTYRDRQVALFFRRSADGEGPRLTYQVVTLAARTEISLLLLKTDFFKPAPAGTFAALRETSGAGSPWQIRSGDPDRATALSQQAAFQEPLTDLAHAVGLVLGPDSLVASVSYTDVAETNPDRVMKTIASLEAIAVVMERIS